MILSLESRKVASVREHHWPVLAHADNHWLIDDRLWLPLISKPCYADPEPHHLLKAELVAPAPPACFKLFIRKLARSKTFTGGLFFSSIFSQFLYAKILYSVVSLF
jgi:hypothetical protein